MSEQHSTATTSALLEPFISAAGGDTTLTAADTEAAIELLHRCPYLTFVAAMMLKVEGLPSDKAATFKRAVALNAPNTDSLLKLIDADGTRLAQFYPDQKQAETPDTDTAIDTFLDQYGKIDPHEEALLERLIFNPVPDYSQVLISQSDNATAPTATTEQDAALDAFLDKQSKATPQAPATPTPTVRSQEFTPVAESSLNESLAQIYIRNHRYDKAYEIIYQLSLNNPKKNIYFADQLRFLKKLIAITNASKK